MRRFGKTSREGHREEEHCRRVHCTRKDINMNPPQYDPRVEEVLASWRVMMGQNDRVMAAVDELIRVNQYDLRLNGVLSGCFTRGTPLGKFAFTAYFEKVCSKVRQGNVKMGSGLLALPAELREKIYEYALSSEQAITIHWPGYAKSPALLRTCQQIRNEASPGLFKLNSFSTVVGFNDWRTLLSWALDIDRDDAAAIEKFSIGFNDAETNSALRTVTDLQDLESSRAVGKIYIKQGELIARILSKLPLSGLQLSSITAPIVQMPRIENGVGEYLLADIKDHWQKALARQVAALITKAAE